MPIVIDLPTNLKTLEGPLRKLLERVDAQVGRGAPKDYGSFEREVAEATGAVEREVHRVMLQSLATKAPVLRIDGVRHRRVFVSTATFYTRTGAVAVERGLYRPEGVRNAPVVDEVGVRVGAFEGGWLPGVATTMAGEMQRGTSREAEAAAQRSLVAPYSRSSFERVGHVAGSLLRAKQPEIEEELIRHVDVPENATGISISLDRVSVPMEEEKPRRRGRPRKGAPKKSVECVYRMAWCATVTQHDAEGKALDTIRYGNMPAADAELLVESLASDAAAMRVVRPDLHVTTLSDGAHDIRKLLDDGFPESEFGPVARLVDFWHVVEKLAAAAKVIHGEAAVPVVARWRILLENSAQAVSRIRGELERSGLQNVRVGDERPVHDALTYLANHADLLDYPAARAAGRPIGSGNVEATCKSLFGLRLKRPGSRWKEDTGEDIVQLRAFALSDRLDPALKLAFAPLRRSVAVPRRAA